MELIDNLALGFNTALSPNTLFWCFIGVTLGTFIGVLPGVGVLATVSMLLPLTFHLDATTALVMLAGIYYGACYGGSTASILLNLPGTPSTAVTCLDGYPMAKQGRAGVALAMTTVASFFGASVGIMLLMLFSPVIARYALRFADAEFFALMLLGLVAASTMSSGSVLKGLSMMTVGIMLGWGRVKQLKAVPASMAAMITVSLISLLPVFDAAVRAAEVDANRHVRHIVFPFFNRTPGPSPFSSTKITPADSRARITASTLFCIPATGPSLASMRFNVGTDRFERAATSACVRPSKVRAAASWRPVGLSIGITFI